MTRIVSRESYFDTGIEVLSDLGYSGLKLAEVCRRLGVTSGSFYHYFSKWSVYTAELLAYWANGRADHRAAVRAAYPEPRERLEVMLVAALDFEHGTEAAIRVWSALDPHVKAIQSGIDQGRFEALHDAATEILADPEQARMFAGWALYTLIGYEQATLPRDNAALAWINSQMLGALDADALAAETLSDPLAAGPLADPLAAAHPLPTVNPIESHPTAP
ncbi:TetR/AcrR family transcriptional regulator [Mycobacterium koreense]|uniref:Uncharacterized protein n=1 Tax=Mycolicibacillus koreensis TaxID=1069220 RepID=A0A7I7SGM2_9MYCO|nr:TetR/AcrR family transcriptional regulator [Mycolicibacillus koreensis]MCV7248745.1 TetR/AcrR family transcriptional regulator [Mycolicibacillus koreensis]OSC33429.1 hypothetical protein B8W67_11200 [Mycolicibacillus koreensis]BBY55710.1 transcriptional regulator [Mycolicibacillus koreensis]